MKMIIAKTAGFCMGVRRAMELVLDAPAHCKGPIYTCGPLIHNPQVLELLQGKEIQILETIPDRGHGTVLIRAHGVPPQVHQQLLDAGFHVIDATCPRVIKVQSIIGRHAGKGHAAIIVGDPDHPEVAGLLGYAGGSGHVVGSLDELAALPDFPSAIIVAQTTQDTAFFEQVKSWAQARHPEYKIFETICNSTQRRQDEVRRLSPLVDAFIVVGGKNSGNTRRLAKIAGHCGKPAYHVETEEDLDFSALGHVKTVGITAGASTPNWVINKIYRKLETLPLHRGKGWRRFLLSAQRGLLLTNVYVALGAGSICFASCMLQQITSFLPYVMISMLYIHAMHTINRLTGRSRADRYNDPDRAAFYEKYKVMLSVLAFLGGAAGLLTAFTLGWLPFTILAAMSILGLSYNIPLLPAFVSGRRYRRIREVPGSKSILIATAWGIATAALPALSQPFPFGAIPLIVFTWSTGFSFVRTAFFDVIDMQGDRIVGKETLPILLGEKTTMSILKWMLGLIFLLLITAGGLDWLPSLGIWLAFFPVLLLGVFLWKIQGSPIPGIRLEFLIESHFLLSGIVALAWALWGA